MFACLVHAHQKTHNNKPLQPFPHNVRQHLPQRHGGRKRPAPRRSGTGPHPCPHACDGRRVWRRRQAAACARKPAAAQAAHHPDGQPRDAAAGAGDEEEIDNDYNDFGSPEQEGHGHRRDREEECFEKTVWDRTFKEILRSEYYIGRFRVRVAAIIARSEWADRFAQTFMHFAEAGKKHIAFTQLTLTRAPVSDCACSACGNSDMEIVSTAVAEMGFKRYRWTLCDTCDATLVWVANCYSTLWAISLPTNGYPKQGYAAFMTPAFVNDTERGGKTAYRELEALLEEGVESGLYSPVYSARK
jgi:hypothetical protein